MALLVAGGLLPGAAAVPPAGTFETEVRACVGRVSNGYVTSGIRISPDDARTIGEACERAVREGGRG